MTSSEQSDRRRYRSVKFLEKTSGSRQTYLERVKALTLEQGWTVSNPDTRTFLRPTDAWGFPKYPDRTMILPPNTDLLASLETFIEANAPFLSEANCWLGTWINPSTGERYLDVTTSCGELDEAFRLTAQINAVSRRKIIAVYNSSLDKTVYL